MVANRMWFLLGSCFIGYVYFGQDIIHTIYKTKTNIMIYWQKHLHKNCDLMLNMDCVVVWIAVEKKSVIFV